MACMVPAAVWRWRLAGSGQRPALLVYDQLISVVKNKKSQCKKQI